MTEKQTTESGLIELAESGMCAICGKRETKTWCTICTPQHYICAGCSVSHKTSRQGEQTG